MEHLPTPDEMLAASSHLAPLPDSSESLQLLARVRAGDRSALDELVTRYYDRLRRIVRARLGRRLRRYVNSVDIVQETFRAALPRIGEVRPDGSSSLLQWLAFLATNRIRDEHDRWAAEKRDPNRERCIDARDAAGNPLVPEPATGQLTPSMQAWRMELEQLLDEAVSELPSDQHEVVILRDYCGDDWDEIARKLGRTNPHAARQLHQRAWIRLRQMLAPKLKDCE